MKKIFRFGLVVLIWFIVYPWPFLVYGQFDEFWYKGFKGVNDKNLSLNGMAEVINGRLRLTNETTRSIGHAFYPKAIGFKNATDGKAYSFSSYFAFAIVTKNEGAHGLAFTISKSKKLVGAGYSKYLGLLNSENNGNFSNHVFAIEFDTYPNPEFGDINDNHVGVDINDMTSNASAVAEYYNFESVKEKINLKSGKLIQAWVDYDSERNIIDVTLWPLASKKKPSRPILSYNVDLSRFLLNNMYVGFSSSTGMFTSSNYILGWSFKMNGNASILDVSALPKLPGPKKKHTVVIVGVSVTALIFMIFSIGAAIYLIRKSRNADVVEEWELNVGPHRYSYQELKIATKGFRDKELLGVGGFGKVYRGVLPNTKIQVAVKQISRDSKQGLREFVSEIESIGRLRHRNLVQLHGWCRRRANLLLVYDFMPNGSLDRFLFNEPKMILSWEQRFKIIRGVASGLLYLHEQWEQIVIHRDIKASNVLLDSELNSHLGDFGLARLYEHGSNPGTTRVVGTLGYLAPELARTGKATRSSDVFGFGALMLEVVCGRRPIEAKALPEELILVDRVWDKWRDGDALDVIDKRINGEFDEDEVMLVLRLGLLCSNHAPTARPSMKQVVSYLDGYVRTPEGLGTPWKSEAGSSIHEGFDDFVHSYPSSSFEKVESARSYPGGRDDYIEEVPYRSTLALLASKAYTSQP